MKQISDKEYKEYEKYLSAKENNRFLTSEDIRSICYSCLYDPADIGRHFLELMPLIAEDYSRSDSERPSVVGNSNWLEAETDSEINELLDMFWGFHDFRIEKVDYVSASDRIDLLLEYDTHEFRVLLRFTGDVRMNFLPLQEYPADWLFGAKINRNEKGQLVWLGADDINDNEIPNDVLWIAGDTLRYALLDDNGHPMKLPEDIVHQVWRSLNFNTHKYEETEKEFHPRYVNP